ncbi:MAG: diguanylate cyclase [Methylotenera sp.]
MNIKIPLISLPNKVAVFTLILICVGFWPLVYFTTTRLEKNITKLLSDQQFASVNYVANELEQKIILRTQALQDVADTIPVDKINDKAEASAYLEKRLAIYRLFSNGVVLIGRDGFGITDYPKVESRATADYRELEYFKEVIASGKPAIGKPRIGRFTQKPGVGIAVPVKNGNGEIKAVMVGFIGLTDRSIFDQAHASLGKSGEYVLISVKDRMIITDTDNSHTLQAIEVESKDPALDRFMSGFEGTAILEQFHNINSLAAGKLILDGKWLILGLLPTREAFAPISKLKSEIYWAATSILIVIVCLVWGLMYRQLRPITRATRLLGKMVSGGAPLHKLPVNSKDEVGQLLTIFNKLQQELQSSHQETYEQKEFLKSIIENEPECVQVMAPNGELINMNPAGLAMLEVESLAEAKQQGLLNFVHPDYQKAFLALNKKISDGGSGVLEFLLIGKKGTPLWLETHASPLRNGQGKVTGQISIIRDITERRALHQELENQAQTDYLTGLSNRRRFMELAEQELARTLRYEKQLSILMVDIDYFKKVNDTYGHKTGDVVLQRLSEEMLKSLRKIDVIGRLGGEEFAVLLPETGLAEAKEVAERLRERIAVEELVLEGGMPLHFTVSIGVTCLKQKNSNIDMLLSLADEALYKAKEGGRNKVCVA